MVYFEEGFLMDFFVCFLEKCNLSKQHWKEDLFQVLWRRDHFFHLKSMVDEKVEFEQIELLKVMNAFAFFQLDFDLLEAFLFKSCFTWYFKLILQTNISEGGGGFILWWLEADNLL